jgi:hypothetical protein
LITALIFVVLYFKLGLVWYLPFIWASFFHLSFVKNICERTFKYTRIHTSYQ